MHVQKKSHQTVDGWMYYVYELDRHRLSRVSGAGWRGEGRYPVAYIFIFLVLYKEYGLLQYLCPHAQANTWIMSFKAHHYLDLPLAYWASAVT